MDTSFKEEFYNKLKHAVIDGLEIVRSISVKYRLNNSTVERHGDWPSFTYIGDTALPGFRITNLGPRDYSYDFVLDFMASEIPSPKSWEEYHDFVYATDKLTSFFQIGKNMSEERKKENVLTDYWKTAYTKWFLPGFIDTYIHLYKDSFQEDFFRSLFEIYYKFIAHNELSIEVWVPIIFMQFDFNCFEIMDDTSIERMSTELQLSRNTRTSSNNTANSVVIGAATHAFRFKNIVVNNDNADTAYNHLNDISFYGGFRDKVNTLLASIRIVWPKCEVGYCQFVAVPVGWQRNFKADLIETFVASERGYPDYFEDYGWLEYGNQIMAESDAIKVKLINETLSTDSKRFSLAMKRLNRASLNSHEDDSIIETAIALESLLSSDSKGDISYRLATRATLLNKLSPFENYNSEQIFRLCKQLYKFRSSIVHGSFRVVKKTFTKNEQELPIVPLGLKFLKHVPRTLISNPQIRNPEDIDKLLF